MLSSSHYYTFTKQFLKPQADLHVKLFKIAKPLWATILDIIPAPT